MIAHRLSTLRHVDAVYFVADGKIAESGSFDELIGGENGLFRSQYELQVRQGVERLDSVQPGVRELRED